MVSLDDRFGTKTEAASCIPACEIGEVDYEVGCVEGTVLLV